MKRAEEDKRPLTSSSASPLSSTLDTTVPTSQASPSPFSPAPSIATRRIVRSGVVEAEHAAVGEGKALARSGVDGVDGMAGAGEAETVASTGSRSRMNYLYGENHVSELLESDRVQEEGVGVHQEGLETPSPAGSEIRLGPLGVNRKDETGPTTGPPAEPAGDVLDEQARSTTAHGALSDGAALDPRADLEQQQQQDVLVRAEDQQQTISAGGAALIALVSIVGVFWNVMCLITHFQRSAMAKTGLTCEAMLEKTGSSWLFTFPTRPEVFDCRRTVLYAWAGSLTLLVTLVASCIYGVSKGVSAALGRPKSARLSAVEVSYIIIFILGSLLSIVLAIVLPSAFHAPMLAIWCAGIAPPLGNMILLFVFFALWRLGFVKSRIGIDLIIVLWLQLLLATSVSLAASPGVPIVL